MTSACRNAARAVLALAALISIASPTYSTPGDYTGSALSPAGDVDWDGYADYLIASPGAESAKGRVDVYHGVLVGPPQLRSSFTSNDYGSAFGRALSGPGDFNADGFSDVAIGQPSYSGPGAQGGRVWVYLGSEKGLYPDSGTPIAIDLPQGQFGAALAAVGDVNGDQYDDLLVGAPYAQRAGGGAPANHGLAYLFYGGPLGIRTTNATVISGTAARQYFGFAVASAGDFDQDGYRDVAIGAPCEETEYVQGRVYLFRGSPTGLTAAPAESLIAGSRSGRFGAALAPIGDLDEDFRGELAIGSPNDSSGVASEAGRVFLRQTASPGVVTTLRDGTQAGAHLGAALANAFGFSGNGRVELLIGEPDFDGLLGIDEGRVHLQYGANDSSRTFDSEAALSQLGLAVASAGDTDLDGDNEILLGAPGTAEGGTATLFQGEGTPVGPGPDPDPVPIPTALAFLWASPNPTVGASHGTQLVFEMPPPGVPFEGVSVVITIHDARGRIVCEIDDTFVAWTRLLAYWDGRDASGVPVRPGVYFARATVGGQTAAGRIVRL